MYIILYHIFVKKMFELETEKEEYNSTFIYSLKKCWIFFFVFMCFFTFFSFTKNIQHLLHMCLCY